MAANKVPGVTFQEREPQRVEEGLSPLSLGIVGITERGPVDEAIRLRSLNEWESTFGVGQELSDVHKTVEMFFQNGGQEVITVRTVPGDALNATVDVDGPIKWTWDALNPGAYENSLVIEYSGNAEFLNTTTATYSKFDITIYETDPDGDLIEKEFFEAVELTDDSLPEFLSKIINDTEDGSSLVEVTELLGGVPVGLLPTVVTDEDAGNGDGVLDQFLFTLSTVPVFPGSVTIKAADAGVFGEAFASGTGALATFLGTAASPPIFDGSLAILAEDVAVVAEPIGSGTGILQDFAGILAATKLMPGSLSIRWPIAAIVGEVLGVGAAAPFVFGPAAVAAPPINEGSVLITYLVGAVPTFITDDGLGNLVEGMAIVGSVVYATGVLAFTTASFADAAPVTVDYETKETATDDGLGNLVGNVDGVGNNTINYTTGAFDLKTLTAPIAGMGNVAADYTSAQLVTDDSAGGLVGDTGVGNNTVDYVTGDIDVTFAANPPAGVNNIVLIYQTRITVTDDGVGKLVGDVDPAGVNTINYETGAFDVTFNAVPLDGTDILVDYTKLENNIQFSMAGGSIGSGVITRADVTDPALEADRRGMFAFDAVDDSIILLAIPDFAGSALVSVDQINFAESRGNRFAILATPEGLLPNAAVNYRRNVLVEKTNYAALYYPWIRAKNRVGTTITVPPIGAVAGIYAKTALNRNPGKAPFGAVDGLISGAVGPERTLSTTEEALVFSNQVNPLRDTQVTGFAVWGARTLASVLTTGVSIEKSGLFKHVNQRILFIFVRQEIFRAIQFSISENGGPNLWARTRLVINGVLTTMFNDGLFAGRTKSDAFFVTVDETNNTNADVQDGRMYIDVGIAPNVPNEFTVVRLQQKIISLI